MPYPVDEAKLARVRGLMTEHKLDATRYLDYVHEIDVTPVPPNPRLEQALAKLVELLVGEHLRRHG
jgi:hypothetical protein